METTYSDKEIIEELKKGNSNNVLQFLYSTAQPKIKSWILNNNGNDDEAQDIFQDSVLSFYRYVLDGKFEAGKSVEGFLFSIGKNMWINRAKQKNRFVPQTNEIELVEESNYIDQTISDERAERIQAILSKLGERCKELLTYSIFYKMPMQEISEKMGFSNANTAKTKNYKCKQRLMKLMEENKDLKELLYA